MNPAPLLLVLAACTTPEVPAPVAVPPHVVVVTLDTTRADRMGAYGYGQAHTPTFDALAARGTRFDQAYSPLPLTIPAHAALFTGKLPATLGIRDNGGATLSEAELTLAEILADRGYATGASVAAFVTTEQWGLGQGFSAYHDDIRLESGNTWHAERPGSEVVDDALAWKEAQVEGTPIFLWVHLYDAHFPYAPPAEHLERAGGRPYDGEIAYVDDQLARVVGAFEGEEVLWVVAGDHGEGLGEHGELTHGLFTYQTAMRVPLVMAGPGVEPGVVDQPMSLVDVLPTVLDHLGLQVPPDLDGRVVPAEQPRPLPLESYQLFSRFGIAPHLGVVEGPLKLLDLPRPELYDVLADPGETADLAEARPEEVARLQGVLRALDLPPPGAAGDSREPAMAMQLEALGYMEGQFEGELSADLPDPKDEKRLIGLSQRADRRLQENRPDEAAEVLATLVGEHPELVEFQNRYAVALARAGRPEEALVALEGSLEHQPESVPLRYSKASFLARTGRLREASVLFQEVVPHVTWSPRVRTEAVTSLMSVPGAYEEAFALGERYLAEYPDDAVLAGRMGVECARQGDVVRAIDLLKVGVEADRPEVDVGYTLSTLARAGGDFSESRRYLAIELEHHPRNHKAVLAMLEIMTRFDDWEGQVQLTGQALARDEGDPELWHVRAQALFNLGRYAEARADLDKGLGLAPGHPRLMLLDANLMAKEGVDRATAEARFEEARAAHEAEQRLGPPVRLDEPR